MFYVALLVLLTLSAAGTHLALADPSESHGGPAHPTSPTAPHSVPEIDLFAGASVLMIAVIVALLLWEWRRRSVNP
ncbi:MULTISPECIES: hypothetical protein [Paracoccus]|uniref:Uncharacterized protein n=1 Tax=Paracoccus versutus TaxID=34007 RepID=A0AAQ0HK83_PARVE|nr:MULTISPECIES: hypothetical protein [Paracoccus]SFX36366.1 hypothetical protein SAMN04244548_00953 [Paracoccus pantotrophus]KGJ10579.1 hypothetical protein IT40_10940 [Paracoccus versutus]MBT0782458.1 hypothetical protein [Paracoccus sp. pheM1]MCJ1899148.1 hypothetical protein [Paracoccus versutus]MDF3904131.1 hypothetical protein [Paracoccus sp. AS002]